MLTLEQARAAATRLASRPAHTLPLVDFLPRISTHLERPEHLQPLCDAFDRIVRGESVRLLLSVPPQHGKTFTILHGMIRFMRCVPGRTSAYVSYAADYAHGRSRLARDMARRAGITLRRDSTAVKLWETVDGSQFIATGAGGPLTGHPISGVGVVDDPYKNREEADSITIRSKIEDWWTSTFMTRVHPGASIIVCHTRWHPDDLIGRLSKDSGWQVINLQAVSELDGRALWERRRPRAWLDDVRREVGEFDWAAMYMGQPRPKGGLVFEAPTTALEMPTHMRIAVGVDFAYSQKTHSDYSVAVVLGELDGRCYVLDVVRRQCRAPDFAATLRQLVVDHPGAYVYAYGSGVESGVADFFEREDVPLRFSTTHSDKHARAQKTAAAWNAQAICLPPDTRPWTRAFVDEVCSFTGVGDRHDDQVDALVAAFDALVGNRFSVTEFSDSSYAWG